MLQLCFLEETGNTQHKTLQDSLYLRGHGYVHIDDTELPHLGTSRQGLKFPGWTTSLIYFSTCDATGVSLYFYFKSSTIKNP